VSVEKLSHASQTSLEENPFTQICNTVTEHIKDNDAYRLYCYLSAKSLEWTVIKEWTAKVCGVGQRKAKQCWSYLERAGLIQYMVARDEKGKIIKHDIRVLNGTQFNPDEPFHKPTGAVSAPLDKLSTSNDKSSQEKTQKSKVINNISHSKTKENNHLSTEKPIHRCKNPPGGQSTRVDFARLLNKDLLPKKDCNTKKRKGLSANAVQKMTKPSSLAASPSRPAWADKKDIAAASRLQMDREAAHIAENESFKRSRPPAMLRDLLKGLL